MKHSFLGNAGEIHFLKDLFHTLDSTLQKRKRRLSQMRFARPTVNGWSFFSAEIPWDILDDISNNVARLHEKCCSKNNIIETLSELVNLSEEEILNLRVAT